MVNKIFAFLFLAIGVVLIVEAAGAASTGAFAALLFGGAVCVALAYARLHYSRWNKPRDATGTISNGRWR